MLVSAVRRITWVVLLGAVLALVFFAQTRDISGAESQAAQTTYRIMPLGDSITQGSRPYDSYRRPLWHLLQNNGFTNVDFVGSMSRNSQFDPPNPDFDSNHEGHSGWRADELAGQIITWATAAQPDIVLLHAGSNDVFQWFSDESTIADLSLIIDRLRQVNPNVKILLAQIIPHNRANTPFGVENLNAMIANLAVTKNTAQSPVIVVDQYTGFNVATDTYDNVHPNVSGEQKLAQKWFQALMPLLTPQQPGSTATPTATATATQAPGTSGFYRAVNFGGPALTIDGNNWEADGAPGVSINGYSSCKPSMVLNPATDANRTTMLRCYRWNQNLTVSMANTPNGSYDVYLYVVDEDAYPQTFGVTIEGQQVANNLSTGANGQWQRLGPWRVNLTDGTINLAITGDGWNAFPGIEVWSVGGSTPNTATPTQTATNTATNAPTQTPTATATSTTAPVNTATPTATNTPTTIPFPTLIPSATPTTVVTPTLAPTATATQPPVSGGLYRAVNLGGPALTIDGNNWEGDGASGVSISGYASCSQSLVLNPATDANRTSMLRCYRWNQGLTISMANIPSGSYDVYLYNVDQDQWPQTFGVTIEGQPVATNLSTGVNGQWIRFGPWRVTVTDGTLNLAITGDGWNAFSGIEVWNAGGASLSGAPVDIAPLDIVPQEEAPVDIPTALPTDVPTEAPLAETTDVPPVVEEPPAESTAEVPTEEAAPKK